MKTQSYITSSTGRHSSSKMQAYMARHNQLHVKVRHRLAKYLWGFGCEWDFKRALRDWVPAFKPFPFFNLCPSLCLEIPAFPLLLQTGHSTSSSATAPREKEITTAREDRESLLQPFPFFVLRNSSLSPSFANGSSTSLLSRRPERKT
ncbi:hypothetical protein OIU78_005534 [Salix suchowensis]|nr:hypothetical protein OIU78_005534 [Salix suchowensis]